MNFDTELNLAEAATQLGTSVGKLIKCGAKGKLTISVVADNWPIRAENETGESIDGLVDLVPNDLLKSYTADFTMVREVVNRDNGETVTLDDPVKLLRGVLHVTADEFRRFSREWGGSVRHGDDVPPYLDSTHHWRSIELMLAVEAWMALFADASFEPGKITTKQHIERWLMARKPDLSINAKERIATLVNPKKAKLGGVRPTLTK